MLLQRIENPFDIAVFIARIEGKVDHLVVVRGIFFQVIPVVIPDKRHLGRKRRRLAVPLTLGVPAALPTPRLHC